MTGFYPILGDNNISATGTSRADAYQLTKLNNTVTSAVAGNGIVLPPCIPGREINVANYAADTIFIYPKLDTDKIGAQATGLPYAQVAGSAIKFIGLDIGWAVMGVAGPQGVQGVSVIGASVVDNHLILSLFDASQGTTTNYDAGGVRGTQGVSVTAATITGNNLIITLRDPLTNQAVNVNAGIVRGPQGIQGVPGATGPQGVQGVAGQPGAKGDTGTGLHFAGPWSATASYGIGDYVFQASRDGTSQSMYVCTAVAHISTTPPIDDPTNWAELKAARGETGPQGEQGVPGTPGQDGAPGRQGEMGAMGPAGTDGIGVPEGGDAGQILKKTSGVDYATAWFPEPVLADVATSGSFNDLLDKPAPTDPAAIVQMQLDGVATVAGESVEIVSTLGTELVGPFDLGGVVSYDDVQLRLTSLAEPETPSDAASKSYVDRGINQTQAGGVATVAGEAVEISSALGTEVLGPFNLANTLTFDGTTLRIKNLPAPVAPGDVITKSYFDAHAGSSSGPFTTPGGTMSLYLGQSPGDERIVMIGPIVNENSWAQTSVAVDQYTINLSAAGGTESGGTLINLANDLSLARGINTLNMNEAGVQLVLDTGCTFDVGTTPITSGYGVKINGLRLGAAMDADSFPIHNLPDPVELRDAVPLSYLEGYDYWTPIATSDIDMAGFSITQTGYNDLTLSSAAGIALTAAAGNPINLNGPGGVIVNAGAEVSVVAPRIVQESSWIMLRSPEGGGLWIQTGNPAAAVVSLSGSTLTLQADTSLTLDGAVHFNPNSTIDFTNAAVSGVPTPVNDGDLVTKGYVDAHASGAPDAETGIYAGGTDFSGAYQLTKTYNEIAGISTNVVAGNGGVILPPAAPGKQVTIVIPHSVTLIYGLMHIYAQSGSHIETSAGNGTATTLASGRRVTFFATSTTQWYEVPGGGFYSTGTDNLDMGNFSIASSSVLSPVLGTSSGEMMIYSRGGNLRLKGNIITLGSDPVVGTANAPIRIANLDAPVDGTDAVNKNFLMSQGFLTSIAPLVVNPTSIFFSPTSSTADTIVRMEPTSTVYAADVLFAPHAPNGASSVRFAPTGLTNRIDLTANNINLTGTLNLNGSPLATVATTGRYSSLTERPDLSQVLFQASDVLLTSGDFKISVSSGSIANGTDARITVVGDYVSNNPINLLLAPHGEGNVRVVTSGAGTLLLNGAGVLTSNSPIPWASVTDKPTIPTLPTLATVATTGSYNDLSDKPSPTFVGTASGNLNMAGNGITNLNTLGGLAGYIEVDATLMMSYAQVGVLNVGLGLTNGPAIQINTSDVVGDNLNIYSGAGKNLVLKAASNVVIRGNNLTLYSGNTTNPLGISNVAEPIQDSDAATRHFVLNQGFLTAVDYSQVTGKPALSTVATTGSYNDLSNKPTIANQTITISGDVSGSGATAITATLPTVNSAPGTYRGITVNGKGLVTGATMAPTVWSMNASGSSTAVTPGTNEVCNITMSANTTFTIATIGASDGQKFMLRLTQDATGGRTVAFDSSVAFGTDLPSFTATTTASKTDLVGLIYNATLSKWMFVSAMKGF